MAPLVRAHPDVFDEQAFSYAKKALFFSLFSSFPLPLSFDRLLLCAMLVLRCGALSAYLSLASFRRTPTARFRSKGGIAKRSQRDASSGTFRSPSVLGRSPSACSEMQKENDVAHLCIPCGGCFCSKQFDPLAMALSL